MIVGENLRLDSRRCQTWNGYRLSSTTFLPITAAVVFARCRRRRSNAPEASGCIARGEMGPRTRFRGVRGIWQVDPRDNRKTTVAMNRDAFPDKSVEIGLKNVLKDKGIFPADW